MKFQNEQDKLEFNNTSNSNGRYQGENPIEGSKKNYDGDIEIRQIIALIIYNKWWFVGIISLITLIALVISINMTPIYESEGTIIISTASNRYTMSGSDISSLLMSSYGIGVGSNVDSELEILNSRSISFILANKLLVEKFDMNGNIYPLLWRNYPIDSTLTTADTVSIRILNQKEITPKGGKFSNILSIKFLSPSPIEAWRLVDLIIDTYSEASTSSNRIQAKAALKFLSNELVNVKKNVDVKEEELRNFMNNSQIVELDTQTKELIQTLSGLQSGLQNIEVRLAATNDAIKSLINETEEIKPSLSNQFNSSIAPVLQRLQVQLAEYETERILYISKNPNIVKNNFNEPRLAQLEKQIEILKSEIYKTTKEVIESDNLQLLGYLNSSDGGVASRLISIKDQLLTLNIEKSQN